MNLRWDYNLLLMKQGNGFKVIYYLLTIKKTHLLQFLTKQYKKLNVQIVVLDSIIANINSTKFLGLIINNDLSWKNYILELTQKLNRACYAIRATKPLMSLQALKTIYFPTSTLQCLTASYFGATVMPVMTSLNYKREQ